MYSDLQYIHHARAQLVHRNLNVLKFTVDIPSIIEQWLCTHTIYIYELKQYKINMCFTACYDVGELHDWTFALGHDFVQYTTLGIFILFKISCYQDVIHIYIQNLARLKQSVHLCSICGGLEGVAWCSVVNALVHWSSSQRPGFDFQWLLASLFCLIL